MANSRIYVVQYKFIFYSKTGFIFFFFRLVTVCLHLLLSSSFYETHLDISPLSLIGSSSSCWSSSSSSSSSSSEADRSHVSATSSCRRCLLPTSLLFAAASWLFLTTGDAGDWLFWPLGTIGLALAFSLWYCWSRYLCSHRVVITSRGATLSSSLKLLTFLGSQYP